MYLKNIEISGFKSFAKKSSLAFNTSISAIVGPNGSGKSNVAEAFRFVLGEQSIKSLRGKKGEDLIFNGALEGARSNRASVKVTFDNSQKFLHIDFPEVTIERVVHRDGVNEYFINGSLVRLRDVVELLSSAHIGASGHHIISQGEADRILSSNTKERRTMIEDALGLKIYQYKRQESERKLDKTLENIQSVESLRKEIAPHIRFLKKQVEKIEKAVELKSEFVDSVKEYLMREILYVKHTKENLQVQIKPFEIQKLALENELAQAREVLESSQNKDAKSQELIDIEHKLADARKEKDQYLQEMGRVLGEMASEERIIRKQKELATTDAGKTVLLSDVEKLLSDAHMHIAGIEQAEDIVSVKALLFRIRELFSNFIGVKKEYSNAGVIAESEEAIKTLTEKRELCSNSVEGVKAQELALDSEYRKIKLSIEKEKDSNRDAEKALFRIMADQNTVTSELSRLTTKMELLHVEEESFIREREESAMLAGRAVLDYEQFAVEAPEALAEPREMQGERRRAIAKMKVRLEDSGLSGSDDTMKEYQDATERDEFLARELEDLAKSAESLRTLIAELAVKLDSEFKEGILKINNQFQEFFSLMFGGGTAGLTVTKNEKRKTKLDEDLILSTNSVSDNEAMAEAEGEVEEGVDIEVSLPRKKIKGLMMLSGGERALTSIALLFAVSQVKPPPFIILDETDAALDEANSKKYGDMIENLSKYSQLILITHNRETMARAGTIYGVTMVLGGISKVLSIQFEEAVSVAK